MPLVKKWKFFESAYEGGPEFANITNLAKHVRENTDDFNDRGDRLHYLNYCETLVNFFANFIFNDPITRHLKDDGEEIENIALDVSLRKEPADKFMKEVCIDMHIYGESFILVDGPELPEHIVSEYERKLNNIRPYWVLVKPYEICDWRKDKFGNFIYVKRYVDNGDGSGTYYEYTNDDIKITEVATNTNGELEIILSKNVINSLKKIPFVHVLLKESRLYPGKGISFLNDLAYNNREILRLTSVLQEFLYKQCFNFLVKENGETVETGGDVEIGSSNVMTIPAGAKFPQYVSPPVDPARELANERALIKNEMFIRAAQDAMKEMFNGVSASGFSQAQSFYKTIPFISSRAEILETAENELFELTCLYLNRAFMGSIKYKDRYEITSLTDALTQFSALVKDLQMPSEEFVKHQLKRLAREYDGKMPIDVLNKVLDDIDNMDFTSWSQSVQTNSTSPLAQQKNKQSGTMEEIVNESNNGRPAATSRVRQK